MRNSKKTIIKAKTETSAKKETAILVPADYSSPSVEFYKKMRRKIKIEDIFNSIQNHINILSALFLIINSIFTLLEPTAFANTIVGCFLCINLIIYSWRDWIDEKDEIQSLPDSYQQKISFPSWLNIAHYILPVAILFPIIAYFFCNHVLNYSVSAYIFLITGISFFVSFWVSAYYDDNNNDIVENYDDLSLSTGLKYAARYEGKDA